MKNKIPREHLKAFHPEMTEEIFDMIFPRNFYYRNYYYALKNNSLDYHFEPTDDGLCNYFKVVFRSFSEAKIVACYLNQLTTDHDSDLIRYIGKDGNLFKQKL